MPLTIARWAGFDFTSGLGASATAVLAIAPTGHPNLGGITLGCLLKSNVHVVAQIGAFIDLWATTTATTLTKNIAENITKGIRKTAAGKSTAAHIGIDARVAILIIGSTLLRIAEHLIGLFRLFEFGFSTRIIGIAIGVVLHR